MLLAAHHSRDTAAKQWSETQDLALQGLGRLLRTAATSKAAPAFLATNTTSPAAAAANPEAGAHAARAAGGATDGAVADAPLGPALWFQKVWAGSLALAVDAARQGSLEQEAALAGLGLLVNLCKLSAAHGLPQDPIKYSHVMRVVDGALVRVEATKDRTTTAKSSGGATASASNEASAASSSKEVAKEGWVGGPEAWALAWASLQRGCAFRIDDDGDAAGRAVDGLAQLFAQCQGQELASNARLVELVHLVGDLLWPRYKKERELQNHPPAALKSSCLNGRRARAYPFNDI